MRKLIETAMALALVLALVPSADASAKTRRHHHYGPYYAYGDRGPIVVERRSFLDPGTKVPVGTYTQYARMPAYANVDPPGTYQAGTFMMDTLHPAMGASPEHGFYGY